MFITAICVLFHVKLQYTYNLKISDVAEKV